MANEKIIFIPRRLDKVTPIFSMGLQSLNLSDFEKCIVSFSQCTYGEPLPMIVLQKELRELMDKNPQVEFVCRSRNTDFRGYADHIGYFDFLGFRRGKSVGEANGSGNYVPIQKLDLNRMKEASGDRPYGEIVEEKASELAHILTQQRSGEVFVALQYSIREMMRNSIEHSLGGNAVFFGQYWPAKHEAEIVICDDGHGITQTLRSTQEIPTDKVGLELAMKPGISGVTELEKSYQDENYRNSGFGLYITSRLCSERGFFRIISGQAGITRNRKGSVHHGWRFQGTCIQLKIRTDGLGDVSGRISEIAAEGEAELRDVGIHGEASTASKSASAWGNK